MEWSFEAAPVAEPCLLQARYCLEDLGGWSWLLMWWSEEVKQGCLCCPVERPVLIRQWKGTWDQVVCGYVWAARQDICIDQRSLEEMPLGVTFFSFERRTLFFNWKVYVFCFCWYEDVSTGFKSVHAASATSLSKQTVMKCFVTSSDATTPEAVWVKWSCIHSVELITASVTSLQRQPLHLYAALTAVNLFDLLSCLLFLASLHTSLTW